MEIFRAKVGGEESGDRPGLVLNTKTTKDRVRR